MNDRIAAKRLFAPNLRQLRAFVAVFHQGKLGAAAQQLFVTQSAVSVLLKQLEDGLGMRLFERTTRSLKPTPAAHEALAVAERILRDVDSLGASLQDLSELRRGRVTVAITPTLAEILLPDVISAFRLAHPHIQVAIDDCAPDQFLSRVLGEQVDFGIGAPEGGSAGVELTPVLHDHLSFVCTPDHPLARRKTVRWLDLQNVAVITVRLGYGIRPLIERSAAQSGIRLNVVNEVSFLSTALWMTASGMGPSIMPAAYAGAARAGNLVVKTLTAPKISRDISVVRKHGRALSPAAAAFIEMTHQVLRRA